MCLYPDRMASTVLDLMYLFNQASRALNTEMTSALAELGITARDHRVLSKAVEADRTQKEIAELALLDKTTMVVTVDGLETAGLVRRAPCLGRPAGAIIEVTPKRPQGRGGQHGDHRRALFRGVLDRLCPPPSGPRLSTASTRWLSAAAFADPPHVPHAARRAARAEHDISITLR